VIVLEIFHLVLKKYGKCFLKICRNRERWAFNVDHHPTQVIQLQ